MKESCHLEEDAWPAQSSPHYWELSFHPEAIIAGNKINRNVTGVCVHTSPLSDLVIVCAVMSIH